MYEIVDGQITGMSFVKNPANETKAQIISDKERIIGGVILTPDKLIYRINPITGEEFYIYFTKESINKLFIKYRKENWTQDEYLSLVKLYAEGFSENEIGIKLRRTQDDITDKIQEGGVLFRNMIIVIMAQNNKTTRDIARRLELPHSELMKVLTEIGGELKEKKG